MDKTLQGLTVLIGWLIIILCLSFKIKYNLEIGLIIALIWAVFMVLSFPEKGIDENKTYY